MIAVGFSRHKGFAPLSWLIMKCEGTNFSHAYIRVRSESLDRNLIYHATGSGVYFIGEPAFEEHVTVAEEYELKVTDQTRKELLQWAVDTSGKPYGKMQLIGLGLKRLVKLVGISIKNPFGTGNKAYICTELVASALKEVKMLDDVNLDEIGLAELRSLVIKAFWEQNSKP